MWRTMPKLRFRLATLLGLKKLLRKHGVQMVYADLTSSTPEVSTAIRRVGRNTTPTIAIYHGDALDSPVVLDGISSAVQIADALEKTIVAQRTQMADNK